MATGYEIGSIVTLKSGGPRMTIDAIEEVNGARKAVCFWFADHLAQKATFALTSIKLVDPSKADQTPQLVD